MGLFWRTCSGWLSEIRYHVARLSRLTRWSGIRLIYNAGSHHIVHMRVLFADGPALNEDYSHVRLHTGAYCLSHPRLGGQVKGKINYCCSHD